MNVFLKSRKIRDDIITKIKGDLLNHPSNVREIFSSYGIVVFDNNQLRYALRDPKQNSESAISCLKTFLPTTNMAHALQTRLI